MDVICGIHHDQTDQQVVCVCVCFTMGSSHNTYLEAVMRTLTIRSLDTVRTVQYSLDIHTGILVYASMYVCVYVCVYV